MGLPKKRTSRQKRDQRRANWKAVAPNVIPCANCREPVLPHHVCKSCGQYAGKQVTEAKE
jgi:large subunit ribosomal protein L32